MPALGGYRHQALGTNLIAVFLTQTYNSSWHVDTLLNSIKIKLKPRHFTLHIIFIPELILEAQMML